MISAATLAALHLKAYEADATYGPFASTHEAAGVALEEWHEFIDAIRSNDLGAVRREAIDLAAVLLRLCDQIDSSQALRNRSVPPTKGNHV